MILLVDFLIWANCPPSKKTRFGFIWDFVRNAMAKSAPMEEATTFILLSFGAASCSPLFLFIRFC